MRTIDPIAHVTPSEGASVPVRASSSSSRALLRWQREQLVAAGLDEVSAQRIVRDGNVDIHALVMSAERRSARAEGKQYGR